MNDKLEKIVSGGNRGHHGYDMENKIECDDGFRVSVIAGGGTYCTPRPALCTCFIKDHDPVIASPRPGIEGAPHDYPGPYTHVEVGMPSERPEPWDEWEKYAEEPDEPCGTVYVYVPVDLVRALIDKHSNGTA